VLAAKSFLQRMKTPVLWAVVIALLYLAVTLFITINLLHDSYNTNAFDLGIFTQDLKIPCTGRSYIVLPVNISWPIIFRLSCF